MDSKKFWFNRIMEDFGDINIPVGLRDACKDKPECIYKLLVSSRSIQDDKLDKSDEFENLPKNIIIQTALPMNISDILNLCKTSKHFNNTICQNEEFWVNKIRHDFPALISSEYPSNKDIDKYKENKGNKGNKSYKDYYIHLSRSLKTDDLDKLFTDSAKNGHTDVVKILLADPRVNPAAQNNDAIRLASQYGHTDIVKILLSDPRVNPNADNNYAIGLASENGHTDVVKILLSDPRVNERAINNETKK